MDAWERDAIHVRAPIQKAYGSRSPQFAELDEYLGRLEQAREVAEAAARRKDDEIAALKAERDLYLDAFVNLHSRVTAVTREEATALAVARAAGGMRTGETVLVPAPNGAAAHNGGAQQ